MSRKERKAGGRAVIIGRNERCPVCGQKRKICRGHYHWRLPLLIAAGIFLFAVVWYFVSRNRQAEQPSAPVATSDLLKVADAYLEEKPPDKWWLEQVPQLTTATEITYIANRSAALREQLARLLNQWSAVSPLAGEIARSFRDFRISFFENGISKSFLWEDEPLSEREIHARLGLVAICFISRDQFFGRYRQPNWVWYFRQWRSVMMAALEYPEPVLASVVFHELGHAYRHRQGAPLSAAPRGSDLYVIEEVEMHELEAQILNAVSSGAFLACIDAILAHQPRPRDFYEAVTRLRLQDLHELDKTLSAADYSITIGRAMLAEYVAVVGFRYIDQSVPPDKRLEQKIKCYRWLTTIYK